MPPVVLVEYDPRWPAAFAAERVLLARAFGAVAIDIEHIGSTAVPGMIAKPILDILIGVTRIPIPDPVAKAVCALGYEHKGTNAVLGRQDFRRLDRHLQLVEHGSPAWTEHLLLRDFLRANPDAAEEYCSLKRALVRQPGGESYATSKGPFIVDVIARARRLTGS